MMNKFPYFSDSDISKPKQWEQHFKSLIKVMIDDEEFQRAIPEKTYVDPYEEALAYVEKNGIKVYALVLNDNPDKLLKLKESPLVDLITIRDVKVSTYSR